MPVWFTPGTEVRGSPSAASARNVSMANHPDMDDPGSRLKDLGHQMNVERMGMKH